MRKFHYGRYGWGLVRVYGVVPPAGSRAETLVGQPLEAGEVIIREADFCSKMN